MSIQPLVLAGAGVARAATAGLTLADGKVGKSDVPTLAFGVGATAMFPSAFREQFEKMAALVKSRRANPKKQIL